MIRAICIFIVLANSVSAQDLTTDAFGILPSSDMGDRENWAGLRVTSGGVAHVQDAGAASAALLFVGPKSIVAGVEPGHAAVLAYPSLDEGFGFPLLDAMRAGTPVVASDLPAYRTVTDNGSAALLSTVADPVALADAVLRAVRDRDLATRLQTAGHAIAARYDLVTLAERYLQIYSRVDSRRHDRSTRW